MTETKLMPKRIVGHGTEQSVGRGEVDVALVCGWDTKGVMVSSVLYCASVCLSLPPISLSCSV